MVNERLKALRQKDRDNEIAEELKRQEDARKKEERTAKREELQRLKEEKKQAQKMRMINLVLCTLILGQFCIYIHEIASIDLGY